MKLKPKHSLASLKGVNGGNRNKAERYFAGRIDHKQELKDAIKEKSAGKYTVLHYYGIGGIGKTRLQNEMMGEIETHHVDTIIGHLNFDESHLLKVEGALVELREQLKHTYKIQFDWFDLACAILWKKVNPHLSFQANQNELSFIEEGTIFGDLVSLVDGLPFVQWVPKIMQLGQTVRGEFKKMKMSMNEMSTIIKDLATLQPVEIEERLPFFFAEDMRRFLKKRPGLPIIFIDTFEVISDLGRHQGTYNEKEDWVKELILQLPEVLWVVFGRERLYWELEHKEWKNILNQTLVDPLSKLDAERFLVKEGVTDEEIRSKIIKVSNGLPYQLDLMLDTYELIKERKIPEVMDFSNSQNQIVERLIKYLTLPERELLKVLSFPRQWNEDLFKSLINKLSIGYPATAIDELSRFSFIEKNKENEWEMHPIMRQSFQSIMEQDSAAFFDKTHQLIYDEYQMLIDEKGQSLDSISEKHLNEMAYHATKLKLTPSGESSLMNTVNRFYLAGRYRLFTPLSDDLESVKHSLTSTISLAQFYAILGYIASDQGSLDVAMEQFALAEQQLKNANLEENDYADLYIRVKREAATIHIKRASYDEARQLLQAVCAMEYPKKNDNLHLVRVLLQLGKLENDSFNKTEAGLYYEMGFEVIERYLQQKGANADALCLNGALYEKKGEWLTSKRLVEQREAYESAIECYEQAATLTKMLPLEMDADRGLAWKRLAENYSKQDELKKDTIAAFERAIDIYDSILARNSDYVEALVKKGHASVDYISFLGKCGLYEEAEIAFDMAIQAFNEAIEKSVDQAAAHNRIASAYREMAIIYFRMGKEELAQATIARAVEESRLLIRRYPGYMHAESTLAKINEVVKNGAN